MSSASTFFHGTTVIIYESIWGNSMIFVIPTTSHICYSPELTVAGAILRVLSGLSINNWAWATNFNTRPRDLLSVHSLGATVANDFLVSWGAKLRLLTPASLSGISLQ
jgi:hypothetical protein